MTALSAPNTGIIIKRGRTRKVPVAASQTIYKNALVAINTSGFLVEATDASAELCAGFLIDGVNGSMDAGVLVNSGSAGDVYGLVEDDCLATMTATSITQAMVDQPMFLVDDQTVDDAAGATNDLCIGSLYEYISTTSGVFHVVRGGGHYSAAKRLVAVSEDFDLDNGAGTTIDRVLLYAPKAATLLAAYIVYTDATSGTVAAGTVGLGTTVGGVEIVAATAYGNTKAVGTQTALTLVTPILAAGAYLHVRHTGVAATAAGRAHVQVDYKLAG